MWINLCVGVPPSPVYKGARGSVAGQEEGAPGGFLLPPGVGFPPPPFLVGIGFGRGKEEREKEKERWALPPSLIQFGLLLCGGRASPLWAG